MKKILLSILFALIATLSFAQVPSYVPSNGLVGWWPFNGNADDESGNGNNGTMNGATLTDDRFGAANAAFAFDGNEDNIVIQNSSELNPALITINAWIKPNSNNLCVIKKSNSTDASEYGYGLTHNDVFFIERGLKTQFGSGNCSTINDNDAYWSEYGLVPNNTWSMISASIDSNGEIRQYLNGDLIYTIQATPLFSCDSPTSTLRFGGEHWANDPEWFDGKIDDIGIWNRALTDCEIQNLYASTNPTQTTTQTACDSYTWNGQTYTTSGTYTGTTENCVTQVLNLTITPSTTNTTTQTACDSYTWNGQTYSASGTYTGTTENCVTPILNLTITPSTTNTTTQTACDSYTWNGQTYTASGTYTGTTANCVTQVLNLTITPSSTNITTQTACGSYTWNGQTYTTSGTYTGTTANCVTQALNLTINSSTSSSISQTALDSYTWPVNNQSYTTSGAYTAVIPNAAGCDSTITLNLTMSFTGINDINASKISIYPNPTNGDFTITGLELVGTVSSLTLTDMNGKLVKVLDTKATKFSMASIEPGVYFLNIISGNKQEVLKIVKE